MATTIQVVPKDLKLKKAVCELAKAENRSVSNMAEQLIAEALQARQFQARGVGMTILERRAELCKLNAQELLRILLANNPFGGYVIGRKRYELSKSQAIDTILRYEGYKPAQPKEAVSV